MITPTRRYLLAITILLAGASNGLAQETFDGPLWTMERVTWQGTIAPEGTIEVKNRHGDIRIRSAVSNEVSMVAVVQHRSNAGMPPEIDVETTAEGLRFTGRLSATSSDPPPDRVDLTLFVPDRTRLIARTDAGRIEAKRVGCAIEATTRTGPVSIITRTTAQIHSEHGDVHLMLIDAAWSTPPTVETVTGAIEVWLPRNADATVIARTSGVLSTDYSLDVRLDEATGLKHAVAVLDKGQRTVDLRSAKGTISLFRSPLIPSIDEPHSNPSEGDHP